MKAYEFCVPVYSFTVLCEGTLLVLGGEEHILFVNIETGDLVWEACDGHRSRLESTRMSIPSPSPNSSLIPCIKPSLLPVLRMVLYGLRWSFIGVDLRFWHVERIAGRQPYHRSQRRKRCGQDWMVGKQQRNGLVHYHDTRYIAVWGLYASGIYLYDTRTSEQIQSVVDASTLLQSQSMRSPSEWLALDIEIDTVVDLIFPHEVPVVIAGTTNGTIYLIQFNNEIKNLNTLEGHKVWCSTRPQVSRIWFVVPVRSRTISLLERRTAPSAYGATVIRSRTTPWSSSVVIDFMIISHTDKVFVVCLCIGRVFC